MGKKIRDYFLIIAFLILLFAPLITLNKSSNKISEIEKRYLSTFPKLFDENGKIIFTGLRSGIENWINDNIGFRDNFIKLRNNISLNVFKTSPSDKVEIGKDGWYFYTLDNNIQIAQGSYPLSEEELEKIKTNQEKVKELLDSKGIKYALIIAPSKVSIYPEMIASGDYAIRETPSDIITSYLTNNSDVNVISLKNALLENKDKQLYFKTDSHWNETGAYIGYTTLLDRLNEYGWITNKPVEVNYVNSSHVGDLAEMLGYILEPEETLDSVIVSPQAERIQQNYIGQVYVPYIYNNQNIEGKKLLIYGDSMFGQWNIPELLAESFAEVYYVWSYDMLEETINTVQPDIVLYEIAERQVYRLSNTRVRRVLTPLQNPQALILSENAPRSIERGKTYDIDIKVKNTGTESWSEDNLIRLCIWQDGKDLGYRVYLPEGVEVFPGEEYTFTLKDFQAPPSNSTYIEFQMLQETILYFGDKKRVDVTVK